jgi:hypothetical protein
MGAYRDRVIADGATNYWRLGEPSGTTAGDGIGGVNGSISAGVTLAQPGAIGDGDPAMGFNGTTSFVVVPNHPAWAYGTGPMSVECWFKTTMTTYGQLIDTKVAGTNVAGFGVAIGSLLGRLEFRIANGTAQISAITPGAYHDGAWHHCVGTLTRGVPDVLRVYIDGAFSKAASPPADGWNITSSQGLDVGKYNGSVDPAAMFVGGLDEVALYPRALTALEIAAHFTGRLATPAGVPGWVLGEDEAMKYTIWKAITPSDTVDLPMLTDAVLVGGGGDVAAVMENKQVAVLTLPAGAWVPIAARRINATGTTATGLVALNDQ